MTAASRIEPIDGDHPGLTALAAEAMSEGFRFVERLIADWNSGSNRFDKAGERLLGAISSGRLVGVCGLNRDPYANQDTIGRLRHLYVRQEERRRGAGAALVEHLLKGANPPFSTIRLRTGTREAASFYERRGFLRVDDDTATHAKKLNAAAAD